MSSTIEETVTVHVDGQAIVVDRQTTGAELKAVVGADTDADITYCAGRQVWRLRDDEPVLDHVTAGQELATWSQHRFGPLLVGPAF